jgi:hypothetical protein
VLESALGGVSPDPTSGHPNLDDIAVLQAELIWLDGGVFTPNAASRHGFLGDRCAYRAPAINPMNASDWTCDKDAEQRTLARARREDDRAEKPREESRKANNDRTSDTVSQRCAPSSGFVTAHYI